MYIRGGVDGEKYRQKRMLDEYDEFFLRFLLDLKERLERVIADADSSASRSVVLPQSCSR